MKLAMGFVASLRRRLACERGFTLVEMLVVSMILVIILIAVSNVGDVGRTVAVRDTGLALAVSESQPGLDRMVRELRQAVAINPLAATPTSGRCSTSNNCVDFNVMGRTPMDASGRPIAGSVRPVYRIRYDCPAPGSGSTTGCTRYFSSNVSVPATAASPGSPVVARVMNWPTGSTTPIFRYRTTSGVETTNLTAARTIDVSMQVPAKGTRKTGFSHNIVLHDGADLKNIDLQTSP